MNAQEIFDRHRNTGEPLNEQEVDAIIEAGLWAERADFENRAGHLFWHAPTFPADEGKYSLMTVTGLRKELEALEAGGHGNLQVVVSDDEQEVMMSPTEGLVRIMHRTVQPEEDDLRLLYPGDEVSCYYFSDEGYEYKEVVVLGW